MGGEGAGERMGVSLSTALLSPPSATPVSSGLCVGQHGNSLYVTARINNAVCLPVEF